MSRLYTLEMTPQPDGFGGTDFCTESGRESVCPDGLLKYWRLPLRVKRVWLVASRKWSKGAIKFKISPSANIESDDGRQRHAYLRPGITEYIWNQRLTGTLYVNCYYE